MTYSINSTYYSDGKRQITILWDSKEGERMTLLEIEDLLNDYFKEREYWKV